MRLKNPQLAGTTTATHWGPIAFDAEGVAHVHDADAHKALATLPGFHDPDAPEPAEKTADFGPATYLMGSVVTPDQKEALEALEQALQTAYTQIDAQKQAQAKLEAENSKLEAENARLKAHAKTRVAPEKTDG